MQEAPTDSMSTKFVVVHPLDPEDAAVAGAMRTMARPGKGVSHGVEGRGQFDALMESVAPRDDLTTREDTVGLLRSTDFRRRRRTRWHAIEGFATWASSALRSRETPLEAIWHWCLHRAFPAKSPSTTGT
jgi:hypothetical protein